MVTRQHASAAARGRNGGGRIGVFNSRDNYYHGNNTAADRPAQFDDQRLDGESNTVVAFAKFPVSVINRVGEEHNPILTLPFVVIIRKR